MRSGRTVKAPVGRALALAICLACSCGVSGAEAVRHARLVSATASDLEVHVALRPGPYLVGMAMPVDLVITNITDHNLGLCLEKPSIYGLQFRLPPEVIARQGVVLPPDDHAIPGGLYPVEMLHPRGQLVATVFLDRYFTFSRPSTGPMDVPWTYSPMGSPGGAGSSASGTFGLTVLPVDEAALPGLLAVPLARVSELSDNEAHTYDDVVRERMGMLFGIGDPAVIPYLGRVFQPVLRAHAIDRLGHFLDDPGARALLVADLADRDPRVVSAALMVFVRAKQRVDDAVIDRCLDSRDVFLRMATLDYLECLGGDLHKAKVGTMVNDPDRSVADPACRIILGVKKPW